MTGKTIRRHAVRVFAPATVSNLGAGFDVIGIAVHTPGDEVVARRQRTPGLTFAVKAPQSDVPRDVENNVAGRVASLMLEEFKPPFGIRMVLHKLMPIASGLGSSAASSVAAAAAVNALLPKPLKRIDLLRFALEGERMASGAPHADNVAPCLLGGACLIRSYDPLHVVPIPASGSIVWTIVHPHLAIRTEEARRMLPTMIPFSAAIRQWGNVGGLILGLTTGDARLTGICTEDVLVEPVRAALVPGYHEVKNSALEAGALGCSLSGSGPSLFAISTSTAKAESIGTAMAKAFLSVANLRSDVYVSRINRQGARVLVTNRA
jgi:homoserine kinase